MRTLRTIILTALLIATLAGGPGIAQAAASKTSLTQVEQDVMCVSCRESLAIAQSPQAYAERSFIRTLIARGYNRHQIEQALVAQYGSAVLAKPPAHGFNLTVYVLPPAILVLGIATLALTLPRWRRQSVARRARRQTAPAIDPAENARLEQELAQFDS